MEKIQDIYTWKDENISIGRKKDHDITVSGDNSESISDMYALSGEPSDNVSVRKESNITVSRKKGKPFDALEKKSIFSQLKYPKNIRLIKRKRNFSFRFQFVKLSRIMKELSVAGWAVFTLVLLVWIILLGFLDKAIVENRVNAWYGKLSEIRSGNISVEDISKKVNDARFDLLIADMLFSPFRLLSGDKIDSVHHVISGGRNMSKALDSTLFLYTKTNEFIDEKSLQKVYFTQLLSNIFPVLESIEQSLKNTLYHYESISWLPTKDLENSKNEAVLYIEKSLGYLSMITKNYDVFLNIFGHDRRKRYLVVFQNADEIRPTGGFMWSMGLLELYKGRVQLFQKKDVYGIEWNLKKAEYERLPAPKGIAELTPTFGLRDANYYANFRDSSDSIKFFTDRAWIELDGIIYINQNILLKFLEQSGSVHFESIGRDITHENFSEIMSLLVEAKVSKEGTLGTPKQILFDFTEVFTKKLIDEGDYFDYFKIILHELESRDVVMWSFNEKENALLSQLWVNGKINYSESLDFVYPVFTSLSGNKSDRYMRRAYHSEVKSIENSCDFDIRFTLKSTHDMWKKKRDNIEALIKEYDLNSPNLFQIQGADRNRQYVRIVLPSAAEVQPQSWMEVVDYGSKKWVEFFLDTRLQETSFYSFDYRLSNPACEKYNTIFYKQAGIPQYDVELKIDEKKHSYMGNKEDFFFEKRD